MYVLSPPLCLSLDSAQFLTSSFVILVIVSCLFLSCQDVSFTEAGFLSVLLTDASYV